VRRHWRLIWRVFPYLRPYRRLAVSSLVITVFSALVALAEPWPLAFLVDGVLGGSSGGRHDSVPHLVTAVFGTSVYRLILFGVAAGLVLAVLINGLALFNEYVNTKLSQRMIRDFRCDLVGNALRQTTAFHDARSMGDFIARINYESSSVGAITVALPPLMQSVLTLAGMAFIAFRIDKELALVSLLVVPFIYYATGYYGRSIEPRLRHVRGLEGRSINIVMEAMSMLRVIAVFGRERHEHRRFTEQAAQAVDARVDVTVRQTLFSFAVNMSTAVGTALVLGVGSLHALRGDLSVGEMLVVLAYVHSVYTPLQAISHSMASLQEQFIFLAMSLELLDQEPEICDEPGAVELPRLRGEVEFEGVSFAYQGRHCTLDNVSFRVAPGEAIAIVGPTGAGKTTLMSLLSRLAQPREGRVMVDGIDVRSATLASLRGQISVVLQEPTLFSGTVADNIRYGNLGASDDEVEAAAVAANAHDFVTALPKGYDTLLGENGTALSGGERQRLCVARAFLKDAPILVLDEPTSSIDSRTEAAILDALERLMAGRTTFMIAHRLSTLRSVDRILVLDHGRLVEHGTHPELIAGNGLYRALHEVQSASRGRWHDAEPPPEPPPEPTAGPVALPEVAPEARPEAPPAAGFIGADPNPITVEAGTTGSTAISWTAIGCTLTEIRVDAPDGPLFAAASHDPTSPVEQTRQTEDWVGDGMTFHLQDVSSGAPGDTLATVVVRVVPAHPPAVPATRPVTESTAVTVVHMPRVLDRRPATPVGTGAARVMVQRMARRSGWQVTRVWRARRHPPGYPRPDRRRPVHQVIEAFLDGYRGGEPL